MMGPLEEPVMMFVILLDPDPEAFTRKVTSALCQGRHPEAKEKTDRHLPTTTTTSGRSLSLPPRPRTALPFPTAPLRLGHRRIRVSVSSESSEEGGGSTNGSLLGIPPRFLERSRATGALVVVDFFRPSCGSCKYIEQGFMKLCKYIEQGFMKLCKGSSDHGSPVIFLKHNVIDEYDEKSEVADRLRIKVMQTELLVCSVAGRHGAARLTQCRSCSMSSEAQVAVDLASRQEVNKEMEEHQEQLARDTCEPKDEPTQMEKRQEQSALNMNEAEGKPAEIEVCQE
ncbi:hypothetical protein ZWY2020_034407 [Hordeum vulgare]|nr:hypothetical protein ZWY2020_034407 [Hordeum vulgare]